MPATLNPSDPAKCSGGLAGQHPEKLSDGLMQNDSGKLFKKSLKTIC
ncbi:hypothetical protein [Neisseria chenwenguii]|nr:hypothetical protein [Neisseria chenwenguii]